MSKESKINPFDMPEEPKEKKPFVVPHIDLNKLERKLSRWPNTKRKTTNIVQMTASAANDVPDEIA